MSRVFEDQSGTRRRYLIRASWTIVVALSLITTLFGLSLALVPLIAPPPPAAHRPLGQTLALNRLHQVERNALLERRQHHRDRVASTKPARPSAAERLAIAFYAPWEDAGLESFRAHAKNLNIVIPAWLRLAADGESISFQDYDLATNPRNRSLLDAARTEHVAIMPLIANAREGVFDPRPVQRLLANPAAQDKLIAALRQWVAANQFQGINVDFELLPARDLPAYSRFLARLAADFHAHNLLVSADLEAMMPLAAAKPAVEACDWVVIMAYDEHSEEGESGPIASQEFMDTVWERWSGAYDPDKLVLATGNYGYDWPPKGPAESISFDQVLSNAKGYRDSEPPSEVIRVDPASRNPWFAYEDDRGGRHTIWFLDAVTAFNQWKRPQREGARGLALWVLGNEDPAVWKFLDRKLLAAPPSSAGLETISFPYDVDFIGRGEVLKVHEWPQVGSRRFAPDANGDIRSWTYQKYAFPFILKKSGYQPKKLVLTFDDGPDPEYTPQTIAALQRHHAPAAFFVLGEAAVRHPGLIRQLDREGFEIGSHSYTHPDLGAVSEQRATLELNATQRALEAILGRSTRMFRPPFNADSQPETAAQVAPIAIADKLNYITIGENIDPTDWNLRFVEPDGAVRKRTASDIAGAAIRDIESRANSSDEGNIILLHDAGGDRSATVAALDILIPALRAKGYQFVSLSELLGMSRDELMPPVRNDDLGIVGIDRVVFGASSALGSALSFVFFAGIVIGVVRAILMAGLALANRRQRSFQEACPPRTAGVLIAAWNEENVIAGTIRSVLASRYPLAEVLVVDDGSTDDTAGVVAREFAGHPAVRLLRKPNGGKASALNLGYKMAASEVLICVDADTVLDPDAVGLLVRHFDDPRVAAVAGNVRVGNADRILTRWQSLEYTTSQNLDRRAAERLNAITVVPGAIGAWRRQAVLEVGGCDVDTLAEDMDLTWRLRLAGYRIENEPESRSFTEAPQSLQAFFKQRFRWAFGTLQCLWKHRRALGRYGWFGRFALPQLWLFQVVFQVLAPVIDLTVALSLLRALSVWVSAATSSIELDHLALLEGQLGIVLGSFGLLFAIELGQAWLAYSMERRPKSDLWFLFLQRLAYRQIMYAVIWKAILRALSGSATGWGKLRRLGTSRAS